MRLCAQKPSSLGEAHDQGSKILSARRQLKQRRRFVDTRIPGEQVPSVTAYKQHRLKRGSLDLQTGFHDS